MWWFNKRREIWDDEEIPRPTDDIQAAHRIRDICRAAADSAGTVAAAADRSGKKIKFETDRYERAAKVAMEIALKISDDLLRDSSVCQIVSLCVQANDLKTARILFRAVQAESIRQDALNAHPVLRQ